MSVNGRDEQSEEDYRSLYATNCECGTTDKTTESKMREIKCCEDELGWFEMFGVTF